MSKIWCTDQTALHREVLTLKHICSLFAQANRQRLSGEADKGQTIEAIPQSALHAGDTKSKLF